MAGKDINIKTTTHKKLLKKNLDTSLLAAERER